MAMVAYGVLMIATANGQTATNPVSVSIDAPTSAVVPVSGSTISVSGTASATAGVARVTWQTSNGVTGTASGTGAWVASGIPVAEGNTTIVIRAYDAKGLSAWVGLVAVRPSSTAQSPVMISRAAELPPPPAL